MLNGLLEDFITWQVYKFLYRFQFLNSLLDQFYILLYQFQFSQLIVLCSVFSNIIFNFSFRITGLVQFFYCIRFT